MNILNPEQTAHSLSYREVVDELDRMLFTSFNDLQLPARQIVPLPGGGTLLVMPAVDRELAIVKLVTVHRTNDPSVRPVVQGEVLVMRASDGERLLQLAGSVVTGVRTASLSMLALQRFAMAPNGPVLVVGSGAQARSHLIALREVVGARHAYLSSRNEATARALIEELAGMDMNVEWIADPSSVAERIRIVIACTDSTAAVVPESLAPGTMVIAVGAFQPSMCEIPKGLVDRASGPGSQIIVDTLEGAHAEAGDLIQADVDWSKVRSIEDALKSPHRAQDITIFKSVGCAAWDLAACKIAVRNSRKW